MAELPLADQARAAIVALSEQPGGAELLDRVVELLRHRTDLDFPGPTEETR